MFIFFPFILFFLLNILPQQVHSAATDPCKPQQIHIALSDAFTSNPTTNSPIKVIFHTQEECNSAYISLTTPENDVFKISATAINFFQEEYDTGNYSTYVHIFDFPELPFSQIYQYSCYPSDSFLARAQGPFKFYLPSPSSQDQKTTKVVMFADMDHSAQGITTLNRLSSISQENFTEISAFIHYGDMGYNLISNAGKRGNDYMNTVQKFTTNMPYMVAAGNHESQNNFSNFNMRFQMPNFAQSQNHFYSFNIGNLHFVSFNLDLLLVSPEYKKPMLDWLKQDLQKANENRSSQPWIIAYSHQPLYCSYKDQSCPYNAQKFSEFEDLLIKYKVDLMVAGHVHFYERMLPIRKGKIAPFERAPDDKDYNFIIKPKSPVYVLQGQAGKRGDLADQSKVYKGKSFTVKVDKAYSFISVKSENSTHLLVENYRSDNGTVNDYFYIVKSSPEIEEKGGEEELSFSNSSNLQIRMNCLFILLVLLWLSIFE